jgi:hypothetical protein
MHVLVDVKEAQTGAFSAGAGFSSADNLLFNVRIQENNLFGRGQRLLFNADVGSIRRNIIVSFTEPYFRGTPLTVGLDAFSWRLRFDEFSREGTGASVSFTYPVTAWGYDTLWGFPLDEVRAGIDYRLEYATDQRPRLLRDEGRSGSRKGRASSAASPRRSRGTRSTTRSIRRRARSRTFVEVAGLGGAQFREGRGEEPLVLHVPQAEELGRPHVQPRRQRRVRLRRRGAQRRRDPALRALLPRAASTRSAASRAGRSGRRKSGRIASAASCRGTRSAAARSSS